MTPDHDVVDPLAALRETCEAVRDAEQLLQSPACDPGYAAHLRDLLALVQELEAELVRLREERDTWRDECRQARGGECALAGKLTALQSALRALVEKWRDNAQFAENTGNKQFEEASDECADELDALVPKDGGPR